MSFSKINLLAVLFLSLSINNYGQNTFQNFASTETDVTYQEMKITIDPAFNRVEGEITFIFKSQVDQLDRFVIDYADSLPIHYIVRGNDNLNFTRADNLVMIELGKTLSIGESDTLLAAFSSENTLRQEFHAGVPVISTDLDLGSLWYPGKRDLIDKIDSVDIYVTTPQDVRAAGNGKLVEIIIGDAHNVYHWQHRHPIATTYLLHLAITNYTVIEDSVLLQNGTWLPLYHYLYPESVATLLPVVEKTPDVMQFYESRFGPYPFSDEKYGHAQYTAGGALEVQTMSLMGFFNLDVIAHELAHQWFGNTVTFGSWSDIWLSEGLAEYASGLAIEQLKPSDWNGFKTSKISSITSLPNGSVFVKDTNDLGVIFNGRLTYNKGAYLAHMLRWVVGDSLFFEALRNYIHDPEHYNGFARNIDLQNHFEAVSGKDLDEFFADWYYGEGYPSYDITWRQEQDSVILWVSQTQSDPSVSFFEMPIPIAAFRFGIIADTVFNHTHQDQQFAMYVGNNNVSQLLFDQDKWIISKNNKITKLVTGTKDISRNKIKVYPNPASDYIEIENGFDLKEVQIVNASGLQFKKSVRDGKISIKDLPVGKYTLIINDGKTVSQADFTRQ